MISCLVIFTSPSFDVAVGEFAAVGDGAVEVVGAEVEGGLGGGFAEHDPVGLDVVEVVEHQTGDGDCFEVVDGVGAGERREGGARRVEGERNEALEAAGLVLLLAEADEVVDAVFDRFDVAVEHRGVGLEAGLVNFARKLEPAVAVAFVVADARARRLGENLGTAAGTRIHPGRV